MNTSYPPIPACSQPSRSAPGPTAKSPVKSGHPCLGSSLPLAFPKFHFLCPSRDDCRNPQAIRLQSCGVHSLWIHLQNTPVFKVQGTFLKRRQKDCKNQTGVCWEIVSPPNTRDTYKASPTRLSECELKKGDISEPAKLDREEPRRLQHYTENYRQPRKTGKRR